MPKDDEWHKLVKGILRAEMVRRGMTSEKLAEKLAELGVALRHCTKNTAEKLLFTALSFNGLQ